MTIYKNPDGSGEDLEIFMEEDPLDPRKEWDNLGVIATWHARYNLGDEQPKLSPEDFMDTLPVGTVTLPVFLFDHGGLCIQTRPFYDRWDSGRLGFIYITPERIEELGVPLIDVEKQLESEVEVYDHYIRGNIYGYNIFKIDVCSNCGHEEKKYIDSCHGFFGPDHEKSGLLESAGITNWNEWEEQ